MSKIYPYIFLWCSLNIHFVRAFSICAICLVTLDQLSRDRIRRRGFETKVLLCHDQDPGEMEMIHAMLHNRSGNPLEKCLWFHREPRKLTICIYYIYIYILKKKKKRDLSQETWWFHWTLMDINQEVPRETKGVMWINKWYSWSMKKVI